MSKYFEGWYFKHQKGRETLAVIAGRAEDGAFIQVITEEGSYRADYPLEEYRRGKALQIGESRFSPEEIYLCVNQGDLELTGRLSYCGLTPIRGDIMGPFRFFPMQCRHTVVSMSHGLEGSVRLNEKDMDFTGGRGYIEGDSGRSFPKSYTWVHCNNFDRDCSIMASAAHIPFAFCRFWGCICVVMLEGREYRLATYLGARIRRRDEKQLLITQGDMALSATFLQPRSGHILAAPVKGKMGRSIREVPCAPVCFEFRKGGKILFQGQSPDASYEHVV